MDFHSGCTSLLSYQQCVRVPFPLHPHQQFFSLMITNLPGVRWNPSIVLISIFFINKYVEHLFVYFLTI
jgi:hypothetical protein